MFVRPVSIDPDVAATAGEAAAPQDESGRVERRHPYSQRTAVLATMHDKGRLIAPALRTTIGLEVRDVAVDTDQLGTFSGDVARTGTPWETAVAKARLGMHATGSRLGLASEGSIGPPPGFPFGVVTVELVVLVDEELDIVVGESSVGYDLITLTANVLPGDDIEALLERGGFPEHGMIVRPATGPATPLQKGIHERKVLDDAIRECAIASPDGRAHVETDLRAHHCPSRRPIIAAAAQRLGERLATCCPTCATPGWGIVRVELGVPCQLCGRAVHLPNADVYGCVACEVGQTVHRPISDGADPGRCQWCNP